MTEERAAELEKTMASLQGELALAREKSSEVDRLWAERARLFALCDELEEEVRRGAKWALEVFPDVVKRIKEDYLASKEFQEEKFECMMDGHSRGFKECVRQVWELDSNFDVTRLTKDVEEEESEEIINAGD